MTDIILALKSGIFSSHWPKAKKGRGEGAKRDKRLLLQINDKKQIGEKEKIFFMRALLFLNGIISSGASDFLLPGCGLDWAVTPLSRALTVVYLMIGAPILYLYLTTTGRMLSSALHFAAYQAGRPITS